MGRKNINSKSTSNEDNKTKKEEIGKELNKRFVVYFANWAIYNAGHNNMSLDKIPWNKITGINHAFFTVNSDFMLSSIDEYADYLAEFKHSEGWNPGDLKGHFGEYKYYKSIYPEVKVLVSIGGWTRGENFHAMASTQGNRRKFINSVVTFLKRYPFIDGIDIDWEFPGVDRPKDPNDKDDYGCPGGPEDRQNFTSLLREIREAYSYNRLKNKLLTIAVPAQYNIVDLTEPDKYNEYLDWINVMTYDIHGPWEDVTNHQAAIYSNTKDPSPTSPIDIKNKYNTDYIMKYLVNRYGVPAYKLNAGSPFFSKGWANVENNTGINGLFSKAKGGAPGNLDSIASPRGTNSYGRLLELENTEGYSKYTDKKALVPWLYNSSLGIMYTYEDTNSAVNRCDYVINNGFGGIMAWEITTDDINGFPLTSAIANRLGINNITKN